MSIEKETPAPTIQFWFLAAFLILVFFTGGTSRIDTQSLIILRPLSILTCVIALMTLQLAQIAHYRWLLVSCAMIIALVTAHIIPLPPSLWGIISGRAELAEVAQLAEVSTTWRPLSLTPMNSWHTLVSLATPLAVILLGIQLSGRDLRRLLPFLIIMILLSGLFGLLQAIGDPNGPLYLYRITNNGSAVGLFANRNHAATLLTCAFPLFLAFILMKPHSTNDKRIRLILSISASIVLVPLILVTGSRSGLILALVSVICSTLLYYQNEITVETTHFTTTKKSRAKRFIVPVAIIAAISILGFTAQSFSRAEALDRFFSVGIDDQTRFEAWRVSLDLFWKYFPFGSGAGSFAETFQIAEPNDFLRSTYLNRAHNDLIETAVTYGVPGLLILIFVGGSILVAAKRVWSSRGHVSDARVIAQSALLIILLNALASLFDYPLRTPIMLCVLAIMALWISYATSADKGQLK